MSTKHEALLQKELAILADAAEILDRSFARCQTIGIKDEYTFEELDHFEALTSRFARLSDIIIQKLLRLIDILDLETPGTVRDRINRAEKKHLISTDSSFVEIRELRNLISHEYLPAVLRDIFRQVMELTPNLLDSVSRIKSYCERYSA